MINYYFGKENPCTFCEEDVKNSSDNDNEYLEFSLCGNDTTLYVREVSVEDLSKAKENELSTKEGSETLEEPVPHKGSVRVSSTSTKLRRKSSQCTRASHELNDLNTKKWSGNTYFEEEIRRLHEQQYGKELRKAIKMRKLWHSFEKEIIKDRRRDLVKTRGPEWWQEPSRKQIILATTLREVIKADYEEEVTGRTRQWLLDLGVTARLTPRQVRRCMKLSLLEPVDFLLEAHSIIVKAQLKVKKKELERPFSINERLLLSAVCVLQLPTLLTMLHYMIPPPKPYLEDMRIQELMFGNLDDETIRYATPYMEPLPFRNKIDFEDWAFGKIYSALLPVFLQDQTTCPTKDKSIFVDKNTMEFKQSLSEGSKNQIQTNRLSSYSNTPSIALLLGYCFAKRNISVSMNVHVDNESAQRKTFGRRLSLIWKNQKQSKPIELNTKSENNTNPGINSLKSVESQTFQVTQEDDLSIGVRKEKSSSPILHEANEKSSWANHPVQEEFPPERYATNSPFYSASQPYYYNDYYEQPTDHYRSLTYTKSENVIKKNQSRDSQTESRAKRSEREYSNTQTTENSGQTSEETRSSPSGEESVKSVHEGVECHESLQKQLINVWKEIESYPEQEQLEQAIKVLEGMGDPLAQLPRIHQLPTIQRWMELRRGKNRILSKKTKQDLVNLSRGMWKSVQFTYSTKGPKVGISKAEERKLTWNKKKLLDSEVRKETQKYFSRIKQEKVDNARGFFPTMLNHYDYGSKLNRDFRDVYFTYLPAREADTFVYRPWQPQETRNSKT